MTPTSTLTKPVPAPAPVPVLGDEAAALTRRTGIPVLLLADHPGSLPTLTAGINGQPRHYTTTATYPGGLRTEVHAPDELVRQAVPGAEGTATAYLATPDTMTLGVETRHDGLTARAGTWHGWTLLTVTENNGTRSLLSGLRLVGADSLPTGRPGRPFDAPAIA
ncbi:hypothetical protein [Kitasatospora sp. NPDC092286]|uniref:hypothetical protein n=1 Tax=Kitasatospora sp. NPDC092286 TaxID=3364087 RepID=UPI0037F667CF